VYRDLEILTESTVGGVATEWTGVDMSTPLLPVVVPESEV